MPDTFSRRRSFTYIAVAVIIGVTAPFTAYAATGGLTNIVDPVNAANKARVDNKGQLLTNANGGTQTSVPRGTPWSGNCYSSNTLCDIALPLGKTVHITEVSYYGLQTSIGPGVVFMRGDYLDGGMPGSPTFLAPTSSGTNGSNTTWIGTHLVDVTYVVKGGGASAPVAHFYRDYQTPGTSQFQASISGYVY